MSLYYVALTGNDNNPGTLSLPWQHISKANSTLQAGDTVIIRTGEYQEIIQPLRSGTATAPITYTANPGEIVKIVGEGMNKLGCVAIGWNPTPTYNGTQRVGIGYEAMPQNYIIIDGLQISYKWSNDPSMVHKWGTPNMNPEGRFGYITIGNHSSVGNIIRNCKIWQDGNPVTNYTSDFRQICILYFGSNCTIENNEIYGTWIGIWLAGQSPRNATIRKNVIHDIGSNAIDIGSPSDGTEGIIQSVLIEENTIGQTNNEDGIQFEPLYPKKMVLDPLLGWIPVPSNLGVVIRKNIFRYCGENSIDLKGAGHILVEDNFVYGGAGQDDGGIKAGFLPPNYSTYGYVVDRDSSLDGIGTGLKYIREPQWDNPGPVNNRSGGKGFVTLGATEATTNVIIRNNIVFDNCGGIGPILDTYRKFKIYNNTFVNNNRDFTGPNSIYGDGHQYDGFSSMVVYGNSTVKKDINGNSTGVMVSDPEYGFVFKNNICVNHNDGEIGFNSYGFNPRDTADLDYNVYCNPVYARIEEVGGGPNAQIAPRYNRFTVTEWKDRNSGNYEGNSIGTTDVKFANISSNARPVASENHVISDFSLQSLSPAKGKGGALTHTTSAGSGTIVKVKDAELFCYGYSVVQGDSILIGTNTFVIVISIIDKNTLEINRSISWNINDSVSLVRLGFVPDIGAVITDTLPPSGLPIINNQPLAQSVIVGQSATFNVSATGALPLTYQWKRNGINISGAISSTYTISNAVIGDTGTLFSCSISNMLGTVLSNNAALTVTEILPPPSGINLVQNPGFESGTDNWSFYSNAGSIFTVESGGDNSTSTAVINIPTAGTNIQLSQVNFALESGISYRFSFRGKINTPRSVSVSMHKNSANYSIYGLDQVYNLTTTWQSYSTDFIANTTTVASDTRLKFWFAEPFAQSGDTYYIDNISIEKIITPVSVAPSIVVQPQSLTKNSGEQVIFSISATGTEPLNYQWNKNGVNIFGATSSTYTISSVSIIDNGAIFSCIVSNTVGTKTSNNAVLTVTSNIPTQTVIIFVEKIGNGNGGISIGGATITLPYNITVLSGTSITMQAKPNVNSKFVGWSGAVISSNPIITITPSSNMTINCNLALLTEPPPIIIPDGFAMLLPDGKTAYTFIEEYVTSPWTMPSNILLGYTGVLSKVTNKILVRYFKPTSIPTSTGAFVVLPDGTTAYTFIEEYVTSPWAMPEKSILGYSGALNKTTNKVLIRYFKPK